MSTIAQVPLSKSKRRNRQDLVPPEECVSPASFNLKPLRRALADQGHGRRRPPTERSNPLRTGLKPTDWLGRVPLLPEPKKHPLLENKGKRHAHTSEDSAPLDVGREGKADGFISRW